MAKKKDKPATLGWKNPPTKELKKVGRPSIYSAEITKVVCIRLMEGETLRAICRDETMPGLSTLMSWLIDETKKEFQEQYARARRIQAELMVDEMIEIADDSSQDAIETEFGTKENSEFINRSRLRVETRKWNVSKMLPRYADKQEISIPDGVDIRSITIMPASQKP